MLFAYGEKFIEPALSDGMYSLAVKRYLQMLDSLTVHFVADEHWTYFDDLYFPNHAVSHIWEQFAPHIRSGKLAGEDLKTLEDGLALIAQTEAYQNYGIPSRRLFKVILRGKVRVTTHNDDGSIIEEVVLSQESGNYGVDIPKNVWHRVEALEAGSVIFECKGPEDILSF